jgi:DNA invertase Pin-like site-specific DNA recombinase
MQDAALRRGWVGVDGWDKKRTALGDERGRLHPRLDRGANPGPDAQRAALERWALARGVHLVGVFEDRGVSGASALDRRPGLLTALDCMAARGAGLLVAARRDRFARDVIIAAQLERLVERVGAKLVSADGASDGDSPEATMMRRILDVFSCFERDLIRCRTRAALATKRAKGLKFGSTPPYGWRFNGELMELDIGEHRAVDRIQQLAAEGKSFRRIATALTVEGFPPRGRRWHPNSIRRILRANPPSTPSEILRET